MTARARSRQATLGPARARRRAWAECQTPRAPSGAAPSGLGRRPVWRADQPCADLESASQVRDATAVRRHSGRVLRCCGDVGQPLHLTARQLLHDQTARQRCTRANSRPALRGALVYVCVNPTVIAKAANRLGLRPRRPVCVSGHPGVCQWPSRRRRQGPAPPTGLSRRRPALPRRLRLVRHHHRQRRDVRLRRPPLAIRRALPPRSRRPRRPPDAATKRCQPPGTPTSQHRCSTSPSK